MAGRATDRAAGRRCGERCRRCRSRATTSRCASSSSSSRSSRRPASRSSSEYDEARRAADRAAPRRAPPLGALRARGGAARPLPRSRRRSSSSRIRSGSSAASRASRSRRRSSSTRGSSSSSGSSRSPAPRTRRPPRPALQRPSGFDLHSVRDYVEGDSLAQGALAIDRAARAPDGQGARGRAARRRRRRARRAGAAARETSSTSPCARPARSSRRTRAGAAAPRSCSAARSVEIQRVQAEGDWRRALELLAGAEADGTEPPWQLLAGERNPATLALDVVVVTPRLDGGLVDRLVQRATARRNTALVYVDGTHDREPALLRLQSAGVAVAVLREGDDLAAVLGAPGVRGGGSCLAWRVPLVCLVPGRRADAELAPARAPAAGRLARAPAARARRSCPRSRRAPGSGSRSSRRRVLVAIALATRVPAAPSVARGAAPLGRLPRRVRRQAPVRPVVPRRTSTRCCCSPASSSRPESRSPRRSGGRSSRWPSSSSARPGPRRCSRTTATSSAARSSSASRCSFSPRFASTRCRRSGALRCSAPALVAAALAAATQPAVAKSEFLHWQTWKPISRPPAQVGVRYVWDSNYDGFTWPRKTTTVFKVQASPRSLYWRSTTLDLFTGARWVEYRQPERAAAVRRPARPDAERPARTARRARPGDVEEGAVRDRLARGRPPRRAERSRRLRARRSRGADFFQGGSGTVGGRARARPALRRVELLAASDVRAARGDRRRLRPGCAAVPRGLSRRRRAAVRHARAARRRCGSFFADYPDYEPLYSQARRVVGNAQSPYAAALALESWLRGTGGFAYTQHPPLAARRAAARLRHCARSAATASTSPARWRSCSATWGFPTRVAEGFTSGVYDPQTKTWTVTDHDAHAWVEVWFERYGWLPFDPTPGRGLALGGVLRVVARLPHRRGAAVHLGRRRVAAEHRGAAPGRCRSARRTRASSSAARTSGRRKPVLRAVRSASSSGAAASGKLLAIVARARDRAARARRRRSRRHLRYATPDPRGQAAACRADLRDFLADQRIRVAPSAAPEEVAALLRAELEVDASRFTDCARGRAFRSAGRCGARRGACAGGARRGCASSCAGGSASCGAPAASSRCGRSASPAKCAR